MLHTVKSMVLDLTGKRRPIVHGQATEMDEKDSGSATPPEEKTTIKTE